MSFGFGIGDFILLTDLAWTTVENARKACGALDSLTCEVNSLHIVLQRLQTEVSKPDSILDRKGDNRRKDLRTLARGCKRVLSTLSGVLEKYNGLSEEQRSVTKLWQKVKFGNGEMQDLGNIRTELATYTQSITLFLNLLSIRELGRVGRYMETHGEDLRDIKNNLHWVMASMQATCPEEKSILTTYTEDDKTVWKEFRRELIKLGVSSRVLKKHEDAIKKYVFVLGKKGALDTPLSGPEELIETQGADGMVHDLVYSWTQANVEAVGNQLSGLTGSISEELNTKHSDDSHGDKEIKVGQHDVQDGDIGTISGFPEVATPSSAQAIEVDGGRTERTLNISCHVVDFDEADKETATSEHQHMTEAAGQSAEDDELEIQIEELDGYAKSSHRPSTSTTSHYKAPRLSGTRGQSSSTKTRKGRSLSSSTHVSKSKSHDVLQRRSTPIPAHNAPVGQFEIREEHTGPAVMTFPVQLYYPPLNEPLAGVAMQKFQLQVASWLHPAQSWMFTGTEEDIVLLEACKATQC